MNNKTSELSPTESINGAVQTSRPTASLDELSQLKNELLRAEVRLAKARAGVAGAEIDIKVLNTRLKAFIK